MATASSMPEDVQVPAIFLDPEMLIPIKLDITLKGGRYVDSFCVSVSSRAFDLYEIAWQTSMDLNLPSGFLWRIYLQLQEQVTSYRDILTALLSIKELPKPSFPDLDPMQIMTVAIRRNTTDYADKFVWDMNSGQCTPEDFARITCADLGLPAEMEPAISHRIRETVIRTFLSWFEDDPISNPVIRLQASDVNVSQVTAKQAVDMVTNLWRRARPLKIDDQANVPAPKLPKQADTNADIWM